MYTLVIASTYKGQPLTREVVMETESYGMTVHELEECDLEGMFKEEAERFGKAFVKDVELVGTIEHSEHGVVAKQIVRMKKRN